MNRFSFYLVRSCWERVRGTRPLIDGALMGHLGCHVERCEGCLMQSRRLPTIGLIWPYLFHSYITRPFAQRRRASTSTLSFSCPAASSPKTYSPPFELTWLRRHHGWGQKLWCDDAIEFIDMTDSPPRKHFAPFRDPFPDLQEPEADIRGFSVVLGWRVFNEFSHRQRTLQHQRSRSHHWWRPWWPPSSRRVKSRRADLGREHKEGLSEHTVKEGCGGITTAGSTRGGGRGVYISHVSLKRRLIVYRWADGVGRRSLGRRRCRICWVRGSRRWRWRRRRRRWQTGWGLEYARHPTDFHVELKRLLGPNNLYSMIFTLMGLFLIQMFAPPRDECAFYLQYPSSVFQSPPLAHTWQIGVRVLRRRSDRYQAWPLSRWG